MRKKVLLWATVGAALSILVAVAVFGQSRARLLGFAVIQVDGPVDQPATMRCSFIYGSGTGSVRRIEMADWCAEHDTAVRRLSQAARAYDTTNPVEDADAVKQREAARQILEADGYTVTKDP